MGEFADPEYFQNYLDYGDIGQGEFAGFDFPDFFSAPATGGEGYAADLSGLTWDTSTGQVIMPSGQPFTPGEAGQGEVFGPPEPTGRDRAVNQALEQYRTQRAIQQALARERGGGPEGILGGVNQFLNTPLGRALAAGGIGAAGYGAARLAAGQAPTLRLPTYTEAPETTALRGEAFPGQVLLARQLAARAGREAVAEEEQAPFERAMRLGALRQGPTYLPGGPQDAIVSGLRAEAVRALAPDYTDPLVEEAIRLEQARLMNQLVRQYGGLAAAETSTPGTDVLLQAARQAGLGRSQARRQAISAYAPAAIQAETGIQNLRRQNLSDVERLSRFGIAGVPETATGLMTLAGNPEAARLTNLSLQQQQALAGFGQATQERRDLSQAIGGIAGQVAGALTRPRNPFEDYMNLYAQGYA